MLTGKTLFALGVGVVIGIAAALHFFGAGAMRALGQLIHGGQ